VSLPNFENLQDLVPKCDWRLKPWTRQQNNKNRTWDVKYIEIQFGDGSFVGSTLQTFNAFADFTITKCGCNSLVPVH
jgi:hypothetical protein